MPVGTQATVKGLCAEQVAEAGASIILANTYHLALRPGSKVIAELGGLHRFMNWSKPILTDSGGFQVFSLASQRKITDRAAVFRSHIDGALLELSPERAIEIQEELGADIAMCLDECPPGASDAKVLREAVRRTIHWAERCRDKHRRGDQALFGIVQGGTDTELRAECARQLIALDFPGYALGGFSVGEARGTNGAGAGAGRGLSAHRQTSLPHGSRQASRSPGWSRCGNRYVRLRFTDPERTQCLRIHDGGPAAFAKCSLCVGQYSARSKLHLLHLPQP